jgi:hypothetical protein
MSCCLETAILDKLRSLDCTPILSQNHFIDRRTCTDCIPYLVLKTSTVPGLRTTSFVQKLKSVEVKAYFGDKMHKMARDYMNLVEEWVFARGCLELGECGCFCLRTDPSSAITRQSDGTVVYSLSFRGVYNAAESASDSESV